MRLSWFALIAGMVVAGSMAGAQEAAPGAKSKMGCDTETEVWNAAAGKCEPGTPKYKRKTAAAPAPDKMAKAAKKEPAKKAPVKKAAAAKKAPPAAK